MFKYAVVLAGFFIVVACMPVTTSTADEFDIVPTTVTPFPTLTLPATQTPRPPSTDLVFATATLVPPLSFPHTVTLTGPRTTVPPAAAATRTASMSATPSQTATRTPALIIVPTGTPTASKEPTVVCPVPSAEPLWVDPVTSPTDQLSQVIVVRIGGGEEVTVETQSGRFTVTGAFNAYTNPALVEITLLPDTVHNLRVLARVRTITHPNGCTYGGYTLSTSMDRNGNPLTIVQGSPSPP